MQVQEFAERMFEEHAVVDRLARGLREWVAAVPRNNFGHWIDGARQRFEHFRAHLVRHFSQEEREGYIKSIADVRPALRVEIDRLVQEHAQMVRLLDAIHRDMQSVSPDDRMVVGDVCRRMEYFLTLLERHEQEEHLLFSFAHDIHTSPAT